MKKVLKPDLHWKEIQLQRRLELAFEGHRFFDLKRRHEDVIRDDKGSLLMAQVQVLMHRKCQLTALIMYCLFLSQK